MVEKIIGGAVAAALLTLANASSAAPSSPSRMAVSPWVITPGDSGCRTTLELTGRSGASVPVTLTSDGQLISLRFAKDDLPTRAFLPIRVDRARFSNLMLRGEDGAGELVLSEETLAAMRKGAILDIVWLGEEPLSAPLAGSEQGIVDLRVCGAQTAARFRERAAAEQAARERAEAEARARTLNEAQLAAVKAQAAAAEAQRREVEDAAQRQRRLEAAEQERIYREARQRTYDEGRRRGDYGYEDEEAPRWTPPRPAYPIYPPPRYGYERY